MTTYLLLTDIRIRELGGVFGVAVLAAIFSANGTYASPTGYVAGLVPAIKVGAVVVALGALAALALPGRVGPRQEEAPVGMVEAPMAA